MEKLLFSWRKLTATFWFIPLLLIAASILLAILMVYIDQQVKIPQKGLARIFLVNNPDSARSILSTISGAMMGVAGTVFSITLVALTLASNQFGPRLIKNFMHKHLNQVVLGSYISTYLYCLLVLNSIGDGENYSFIPSISILFAIIAAIGNIILLIIFIHQIAISIQADKLISDISEYLSNQIEMLFPKNIGSVAEPKVVNENDLLSGFSHKIPLKSSKSGYLQYIDNDELLAILTKKEALLEMYYRPGDHLVEGERLGMLFLNKNLDENEFDEIYKQFVIGKIRTSQQDLEFSILQMVEIAVRALSPGVNDPFTAIACIDNLKGTLSCLAQAEFPSKYCFDTNGSLRIISDVVDFEGILNAAFNQIRQNSGGSPAVIIRLMEAMITIEEFTRIDNHKKAVIQHAEMILRIGKQTIKEENDLADLNKRAEELLK